jgi:hypothetical protein
MLRYAGAKNRTGARLAVRAEAARRFGTEATTHRSQGACGSSPNDGRAAWQPRNPIGSLSPCAPLVTSSVQSAGRPGTRIGRWATPARCSSAETARLVGSSSDPRAPISSPPKARA